MEFVLENGVRLVYENRKSDITSFCIGFEAGAAMEDSIYGTAHATEHMVYKGTKNLTEAMINKELSSIFAFQNAMTNYPYAIYYGSLLKEDFEKGIKLFQDILLHPEFNEDGFKEEMDVIKQELNEWDEDLEQFCEDKLYFNSINNRLKYPIIGRHNDLNKITLKDIKEFYNKYYYGNNAVISVVSSIPFNEVKDIVIKYFGKMRKGPCKDIKDISGNIKSGIFEDYRNGIGSSRVEIIYSISNLTNEELGTLKVLDEYLGKGVNSLLYDTLRTKNGLVYDILTNISYEKHISLYKITFNASENNLNKAINLVENSIKNIKKLNENEIKALLKQIKLKKLFNEEKSINYAKKLCLDKLMNKEIEIKEHITGNDIINLWKKVLVNPSIEIIKKGLKENE